MKTYKPNELTDFFVVDVETTGFDPASADVIEIAAVKVSRNEKGRFEIKDQFDCYVNPEYPLPPDIVEFNKKNDTGIDDELLSRSPKVDEAAKKFMDFIGKDAVVVGHNIVAFDNKFINKFCTKGTGQGFEPAGVTDTLLLSRELDGHKKNNLGVCFERTAKRHSSNSPKFHTAIADVICTLDVLEYLDDKYFTKNSPDKELTFEDITGSESSGINWNKFKNLQPSAEQTYTENTSAVQPQSAKPAFEEYIPAPVNKEIPDDNFTDTQKAILRSVVRVSEASDIMMIAGAETKGVGCVFDLDTKSVAKNHAVVAFSTTDSMKIADRLWDIMFSRKNVGGISIEKTENGTTVYGYGKHKKNGLYCVTTKRLPPLRYKDEMVELACAIDDVIYEIGKYQREQNKQKEKKSERGE